MVSARVAVPALIVAGVLAGSEWVHWRASGRRLGSPSVRPGREAILVLGCRNRGLRINAVNRYRVRVALRSIDPSAEESVLVFAGGAIGSDVSEADLLLRHAGDDLGYQGPSALERLSRSTWENIANSIPLLEGFDTLKIASNSLHAERARGYLWRQRPDLAQRLVRAEEHRVGEIPLLKPLMAVRGLRALWRATM